MKFFSLGGSKNRFFGNRKRKEGPSPHARYESRFILFRRADVFYFEYRTTRKQTSLRTRDENEALTLLHAKNESVRQPILNLQIARAYLTAGDPAMNARTWQHVMEQIISSKTGGTRQRGSTPARIGRLTDPPQTRGLTILLSNLL